VYRLTRKGEDIRNMFGAIAPRYDFLNRLLSLGIDRRWRKVAVGMIRCPEGGRVLDVATGTGDVALEIASRSPASVKVTGIDFCREMVDLGRVKVADSPYAGRISLEVAPCEEIPFADDTFDAATIAFGIRNVVDRKQGLAEMHRVLKPGGIMVILEFSTPVTPLFRRLYHWYFLKVLPPEKRLSVPARFRSRISAARGIRGSHGRGGLDQCQPPRPYLRHRDRL
jgi:demethylmenaquinone methyltransferase / 2-methoxy-6-polyprenyl-1,4-benzoquinol methylase